MNKSVHYAQRLITSFVVRCRRVKGLDLSTVSKNEVTCKLCKALMMKDKNRELGSERNSYYADTKEQIIAIIEGWGKHAIYRYLRDNNILDAFIEQLPMKDFKATGESQLQKTLKAMWDDYSPNALAKLQQWQDNKNQLGALGHHLASYGADLYKRGFRHEATSVLKMAARVTNSEERVYVTKQASELEIGDLLYSVGVGPNERLGFTTSYLPGKIERIIEDPALKTITANVHVLQLDEHFKVALAANEVVKIIKTVRPYQAAALKHTALAKLIQAELELKTPHAKELQAKLARVRHMLEQELQ